MHGEDGTSVMITGVFYRIIPMCMGKTTRDLQDHFHFQDNPHVHGEDFQIK